LQRVYAAKHKSALEEHVREYAREELLGEDRQGDEQQESGQ
jgi:plasmid stability protein